MVTKKGEKEQPKKQSKRKRSGGRERVSGVLKRTSLGVATARFSSNV